MYEMMFSMPKLTYFASVVNKLMVDSGHIHWEAFKWVLRY